MILSIGISCSFPSAKRRSCSPIHSNTEYFQTTIMPDGSWMFINGLLMGKMISRRLAVPTIVRNDLFPISAQRRRKQNI